MDDRLDPAFAALNSLIYQISRVKQMFGAEMLAGPFAAFGQFDTDEVSKAFKAAVANGAEKLAVAVPDGDGCSDGDGAFDL